MAKLRFEGSLALRLRGFMILSGLAVRTRLNHLLGRRLDPSWDADFETGIRFWRRQFTRAMSGTGMARGRQILDSVQTETDDVYPVRTVASAEPRGRWYEPDARKTDAVALYLHGGGYAFHSAISGRFAAMLAHHGGIRLFAPDYRLTPEHPHPAQQEDALAAWDYVTSRTAPDRVVVIGDSAGGHMALMLLQSLRRAGREQPALCVGLCPWTDIGVRGDSLRQVSNDIAQPAIAGGLVLIVMLLGFTAVQHAFSEGQVSIGTLSEVERRALALTRGLLTSGVLVKRAEPDAYGGWCALADSVGEDFALNQPLAPFAVASLDLLDREGH